MYVRKPSNLPKKIQIWKKTVVDKVLTLFNYWSNNMEKLIAAIEIFLFCMIETHENAIDVYIYDSVFLVDLKKFPVGKTKLA